MLALPMQRESGTDGQDNTIRTSAFGDAVLQWGTANSVLELESTSPQQTTRICNYATRQSYKGSNIGASELWCLY